MRVLIAESELAHRVCLSVWISEINASELAGLARSRKELQLAVRVSNADVVVVSWDLLASDFEALVTEFRSLEPLPKIIIVSWQAELDAALSSRGVDAIIYGSELPEALHRTLLDMQHDVNAMSRSSGSTPEQLKSRQDSSGNCDA